MQGRDQREMSIEGNYISCGNIYHQELFFCYNISDCCLYEHLNLAPARKFVVAFKLFNNIFYLLCRIINKYFTLQYTSYKLLIILGCSIKQIRIKKSQIESISLRLITNKHLT